MKMKCLRDCWNGLHQLCTGNETGKPGECTWTSKEYEEYELEFQKYVSQNLQNQSPAEDFATEHWDDAEVLRGKLRLLQCLCQNANYIVVFTGAGISTSAGLPDYRGPQGVWTRKLKGERVSDDLGLDDSWQPSSAHMAIARLHSKGFIKFVATTNVDDLHGKSGVPEDSLAELHGNSFVEECEKCLQRYKRSFVTRSATGLFEHHTGRYCQCGGPLRDTIVNFGNTFEHVPSMEDQHDAAWVHCLKADLVLVLGSSLSVPTACDLPEECLEPREGKQDGGKLVIVNLQRTPKDFLASLKIFASCDDVMAFLEEALSKDKAP